MELSLHEIWQSMGMLAKMVAACLIVMGVASLGVTIERLFILRASMRKNGAFVAQAEPVIASRELGKLRALTEAPAFARVPLAKLLRFALDAYKSRAKPGESGSVEMARRELDRRLEQLSAELRRGMGILASTGSTAPFVGLFGTVIGIITAFRGIAAAGGGGLAAVSAGIAEALIVTAVGLVVAIVSVLFFNYLTARFDRFDMQMQHAVAAFLDSLETQDGHAS